MKKIIPAQLVVVFLFLFSAKSYCQPAYSAAIKNITKVDSKTLRFDVWMQNTGTPSLKLQGLQAGITLNYDDMANGGTITGSFVAGSADTSLPAKQQILNWKFNPVSHQIQLFASLVQFMEDASTVPAGAGIRLGTFELKNTNDFSSVTPVFSWSFANGSTTTTTTIVRCFVNNAERGSNITNQSSHVVIN